MKDFGSNVASKYSISRVEKFLDYHEIVHYWRRHGSQVYLICKYEKPTTIFVFTLQADKLEFWLKQHCKQARLTSIRPKTVTYFMYDLIELLKSSN